MDCEQLARAVKLIVLDVDGVLSDGRIYYGNAGEELKGFNVKDGLGIKLLQRADIEVAIITARVSAIVVRRGGELGIGELIQGREDKRAALIELCERRNMPLSECAYMGDDLPDLGAINAAGLGLTVADARPQIREAADWVATMGGGQGAVREAAEFILNAQGKLDALLAEYY